MHIGMILNVGDLAFPPDIRVQKEARALTQAGYRVSIFTRRIPDNAAEREYSEEMGANIIRARVRQRTNPILKVIDAINLYFPLWIPALEQFIEVETPDILHVHDLPMVPTVIRVAKKYRLPVVADLHENMPAACRALRSNFQFPMRLINACMWNYTRMRMQEAAALRQCSRVVIVVPEAAERLHKYGIPPEKIFVVSNTEDDTTFSSCLSNADTDIVNGYKDFWIASYIGGINPHRGLDTTLEAVPHVFTKIPNFKLLIVGANEKQHFQIERESIRLGINQVVEIVGWQPSSKVNSFVMASKVGLVPHRNFEHTQTTVPHKLFQYMLCSKPVLVSDCRPLARIVNDTGAGRVFVADNPLSLAHELVWMYQHPKRCLEYGRNGQEAALGNYAWRNDAKTLIDMYEGICEECHN